MSYDISVGGEDFNYTYNVFALFYDHFPRVDEIKRGGLNMLHGMTGKRAAEAISDAFNAINRTRHLLWESGAIGEPYFCAKYDAKNSWGSAVGALIFLAMIMAACHRHPRAIVRVS